MKEIEGGDNEVNNVAVSDLKSGKSIVAWCYDDLMAKNGVRESTKRTLGGQLAKRMLPHLATTQM